MSSKTCEYPQYPQYTNPNYCEYTNYVQYCLSNMFHFTPKCWEYLSNIVPTTYFIFVLSDPFCPNVWFIFVLMSGCRITGLKGGAHTIDLCFKNIVDVPWEKATVAAVKKCIKFIKHHQQTLAVFKG